MNPVDDHDATIKGWRTVAGTLALGSLVLVAALGWQPLTLLIDTVLHWRNIAMGLLSQVALIACVAGSYVMITTIASGTQAGRHPALRDCAVQPCGRFHGGEPGDVLRRKTAVRGAVPTGEPCLIVDASAVVVRAARVDHTGVVGGGHALFEPLSRTGEAQSRRVCTWLNRS
jgi:hypothetical protein